MNPRHGTALAACALILVSIPSLAEARDGTICVAAVPQATQGEKSLGNATASEAPYAFEILVDDRAAVATSHETSIALEPLDVDARHRIRILRNGAPFASFAFGFDERGSDALCLWFGALYESWSLAPAAFSGEECRCSDVAVATDASEAGTR